MFKAFVTVTVKKWPHLMPWNRTLLTLAGEKEDLKNLQTQLEFVKQDVNADMNKNGASLKDVDIKIEF